MVEDSKRNTRDLMGELHYLRSMPKSPTSDTCEYTQPWPEEVVAEREARMAQLRTELSTREHIPGILEGKLARKAAAQKNRGQGKGKSK